MSITAAGRSELTRAFTREVVRDPKTLFTVYGVPLAMFVVYVGVGSVFPSQGDFDFVQAMMPNVLLVSLSTSAFYGGAMPLMPPEGTEHCACSRRRPSPGENSSPPICRPGCPWYSRRLSCSWD